MLSLYSILKRVYSTKKKKNSPSLFGTGPVKPLTAKQRAKFRRLLVGDPQTVVEHNKWNLKIYNKNAKFFLRMFGIKYLTKNEEVFDHEVNFVTRSNIRLFMPRFSKSRQKRWTLTVDKLWRFKLRKINLYIKSDSNRLVKTNFSDYNINNYTIAALNSLRKLLVKKTFKSSKVLTLLYFFKNFAYYNYINKIQHLRLTNLSYVENLSKNKILNRFSSFFNWKAAVLVNLSFHYYKNVYSNSNIFTNLFSLHTLLNTKKNSTPLPPHLYSYAIRMFNNNILFYLKNLFKLTSEVHKLRSLKIKHDLLWNNSVNMESKLPVKVIETATPSFNLKTVHITNTHLNLNSLVERDVDSGLVFWNNNLSNLRIPYAETNSLSMKYFKLLSDKCHHKKHNSFYRNDSHNLNWFNFAYIQELKHTSTAFIPTILKYSWYIRHRFMSIFAENTNKKYPIQVPADYINLNKVVSRIPYCFEKSIMNRRMQLNLNLYSMIKTPWFYKKQIIFKSYISRTLSRFSQLFLIQKLPIPYLYNNIKSYILVKSRVTKDGVSWFKFYKIPEFLFNKLSIFNHNLRFFEKMFINLNNNVLDTYNKTLTILNGVNNTWSLNMKIHFKKVQSLSFKEFNYRKSTHWDGLIQSDLNTSPISKTDLNLYNNNQINITRENVNNLRLKFINITNNSIFINKITSIYKSVFAKQNIKQYANLTQIHRNLIKRRPVRGEQFFTNLNTPDLIQNFNYWSTANRVFKKFNLKYTNNTNVYDFKILNNNILDNNYDCGYISKLYSNIPSIFWCNVFIRTKSNYYASVGFPKDPYKFNPKNFSYPSSYITNVVNKLFEFIFQSKTSFVINTDFMKSLTITEITFLKYITRRLQTYAYQFSTIFFLSEFIEIVFLGLKQKNLTVILSYIQKILNKLIIWDHKRFFVFLYELFREHFFYFFDSLNIKGMRIILKGKIGVGGNSRKRKMYLKLGSVTKIQPFRSVQTMNALLSTTTGALGLTVNIYYNN